MRNVKEIVSQLESIYSNNQDQSVKSPKLHCVHSFQRKKTL